MYVILLRGPLDDLPLSDHEGVEADRFVEKSSGGHCSPSDLELDSMPSRGLHKVRMSGGQNSGYLCYDSDWTCERLTTLVTSMSEYHNEAHWEVTLEPAISGSCSLAK